MIERHFLYGVLSATAFLSILPAQSFAAAQTGTRPEIAHRGITPISIGHEGVGDRPQVCAAGETYKALFRDQMTFVPYLGIGYPENLPWSFRVESMGGDRGARHAIDRAAMKTSHDATRFQYHYPSDDLVERYDVLAAGLEQSFVLARMPTLGDSRHFVLRGRVDSPLTAAPRGFEHAAVDYLGPNGETILRYGEAVAIDARGQRMPIETAVSADGLELRVPATWLAAAEYPVVLDPLVGRVLLATGTVGISDVVYDDGGNDLLVAYTLAASASDRDVYADLHQGAFGSATRVFADLSTADSPVPAVAAAGQDQDFLIVFSTQGNTLSRLRYRFLQGGMFSLQSGSSGLTVGSGQHYWRPDVGGMLRGNSKQWMIACQYDLRVGRVQDTSSSAVWVARLTSAGIVEADFLSVPTEDADRPSINQARDPSAFPDNGWLVAWQSLTGSHDRIRAVLTRGPVSTPVPTASWTSPSSLRALLAPKVAGSDGRFLVAYTVHSISSNLVQGSTVAARRFDATLSTVGDEQQPGPTRSLRQYVLADAAFDHETRSHWSLQILNDRTFGGDGRVFQVKTGYTGEVIESATLSTPVSSSNSPIRGGCCYLPDGNRFATVWGTTGVTQDLLLGDLQTYPSGGDAVSYGTACNPVVDLYWGGRTQIGSEFCLIGVRSAPPNTFGSVVLSLQPDNLDLTLFGYTGCRVLASLANGFIGTFPVVPNAAGIALIDLPLSPSLPAAQLYFQAFFLSTTPGVLRQSRGLEVTLVK